MGSIWITTVCAASLLASTAHASPRAVVRMEVHGALGDEVLGTTAWLPLVVRLSTQTRIPFRGRLVAEADGYPGRSAQRAERRIDVAGGGSTTVELVVPAADIGRMYLHVDDDDGDTCGSGWIDGGPRSGPSVAVLTDPIQRGALLELRAYDVFAGYRGAASEATPVAVNTGTVMLTDSGAPRLPETPLAYGGVSLFVVQLPLLDRATPPARRALAEWVASGGRVLVVLGSGSDLGNSWLTALVGHIAPERAERVSADFASGAATSALLLSQRSGFGWVHVTALPGEGEHPWTEVVRDTVTNILQSTPSPGDHPVFPAGGTTSAPSVQQELPSELASALDPNQVSGGALFVAGLLLLLYVVAVGPLNFKLLSKRRPTLALVTTPALAIGCALLLLVVGVASKGVSSRYRRIELLETVEGSRLATSRRYTGLLFTHPTEAALAFAPGRRLTLAGGGLGRGTGRGTDATAAVETGRALTGLRGGFWDTELLREDGVVSLGGSVTVEGTELADGTLAARGTRLHNRTRFALRDALVISRWGICAIGTVAPGARVPLRCTWTRRALLTAADERELREQPGIFWRNPYFYDVDHLAERAAATLGGADGARIVRTVMEDRNLVGARQPTLLARIDGSRERLGGTFSAEQDIRIVRVVPALPGGWDWMRTGVVSMSPTASASAEVAR